MTTKSIITTIIIVLVVVAAGLGIYFYSQSNTPKSTSSNTVSQTGPQGNIVFGIKDAAASMGSVTSVMVTVNSVDVHSAAQGWVNVSSQPQQYDLLALKQSGQTNAIAKTNIAAGAYDQMRLTLSKVTVVDNGTSVDAKLPSETLAVMGNVSVDQNQTATAVFDFQTSESLHATSDGKFIFTPVVNLQTESDANAQVDANNVLTISNGTVDTNTNVGMDVDGEVKTNFMVGANANLGIVGNVINVNTAGDTSVKITADAAASAAVSAGALDSAVSTMITTQNGKQVWQVSGLKNLMPTTVIVDATTGAVISAGSNTSGSTSSSVTSGIMGH